MASGEVTRGMTTETENMYGTYRSLRRMSSRCCAKIQEILVLLAKILTLEMSAVKDCLVVTDERELAVAVLNLSTELLSIHNMVGPPTTFHKLGQSLALASAGLQGGSQILGWL
eukprot:GHVQ01026412.1.p1 GENE.GHVQ01026412.1~~GHVQ01026412.1.p1  ORF type:complete len:114 (+),score=11.96 GHVQ01026412.1:693-1034(+)